MSDFIEVTSDSFKTKNGLKHILINIGHISDICEDENGNVTIYIAGGVASYSVKETYDEIVKKIKDAKYFTTSYPTNTSLYEEQTQNQGYTLV